MIYNFDEVIDRKKTDAVKWKGLATFWGRDDLYPMWIADMDFRTPPFVLEAINKKCAEGILGYAYKPDNYHRTIKDWLSKRYNWKIAEKEIGFSSGIVPGLAFALQCFTQKRDKVLIQPPVYHPFHSIIVDSGRTRVTNPLKLIENEIRFDIDHFREQVKGCKIFILCNPHNPGGYSWTQEELQEIAEVCYDNGTLVLSDEIHADLTLRGHTHVPFATVSKKAKNNSITFMAASKAFNIAGLSSSYYIVKNKTLREKFSHYLEAGHFAEGHLFAYEGVLSCYTKQGEEWLSQVQLYIQDNIDFVIAFLEQHIPCIRAIRPQASFLIFLDCRDLHLCHEKLIDFFVDKAHLALNDGAMFGKEGSGFMRMNIACPRSVLRKALENLLEAYQEMKG